MAYSLNKLKKGAVALAAAGLVSIAAAPAMADDWHHNGNGHGNWNHGNGNWNHGRYYNGRGYNRSNVSFSFGAPVYRPYYYAPRPVYYQPAPVYYQPTPVYYQPAYYPQPYYPAPVTSFSFGWRG